MRSLLSNFVFKDGKNLLKILTVTKIKKKQNKNNLKARLLHYYDLSNSLNSFIII
jgi:hypothetical protein